MASYAELFDLRSNAPLLNKITAAVAVAAFTVNAETTGTNLANRKAWAKRALQQTETVAREMLWGILAANQSFTVAQITGATDTAVRDAVLALVDLYAIPDPTPV